MSGLRHQTSHFGVRLILRGRCVGELADLPGGSEVGGTFTRARVYVMWRRVWHCDQWYRLSSISVLDEVNFLGWLERVFGDGTSVLYCVINCYRNGSISVCQNGCLVIEH